MFYNCMLTINAFSDGRTYVTGNRCDRGAGDMIQEKHKPVPNMVDAKLRRYFDYFLKKIFQSSKVSYVLVYRASSIYTKIFRSGLHSSIN